MIGRRAVVATSALVAGLLVIAVWVLSTNHSAPRRLWGAQLPSEVISRPQQALRGLSRQLGKRPAVAPFNVPFQTCWRGACTQNDFPRARLDAIRSYGAITMLNWSSMASPLAASEPQFTLAAVASGAYDTYIRSFAQAAAAWGHPFLLRFDWEMNGNWFPWAEGANGNQPGSFVAAWRHVHDIFVAAGASNAKWVWCPNVDFEHQFVSYSELYPGSSYVDWTCLDGYNFGGSSWMTFNQVFSSSYQAIQQIAPSKPLIIGETASVEAGGSKAAWITDMFNQLASGYPNIRALVWFDASDGGNVWPLESSLSAEKAFAAGIASPAYTTNTYKTASTITP
jgi:hypothetical protein